MYKISVTPEDIEKLPLGAFPGEIVVVKRAGRDYNRAIAYLKAQKVIGFDTETRPVFEPGKPHHHTALLQLSGPDKAYLFRIFKMGMRKRLCAILSNPEIIKVGAAVHDDVRGLQYYTSFQPEAFVDLQKIAWEWGIRDKSVKKLAANILGCRISKTQQLSNWEADSLSESQQMYAATDAWVCLEMYDKLLKSEKHPLTPEELNPPQPQQEAAKKDAQAADKPKKKKRPNHHRKSKPKVTDGQNNTEKGA